MICCELNIVNVVMIYPLPLILHGLSVTIYIHLECCVGRRIVYSWVVNYSIMRSQVIVTIPAACWVNYWVCYSDGARDQCSSLTILHL